LGDAASASPENGVYGGSPARATQSAGQLGVDLIIAGAVSDIRVFRGGK
jgi:creatinine amidohydrolase/Fe(II)-dependent formamide hydrolase-like protein